MGVDLERTQDGIIIRIPGAKVSETKGQPMRSVLIDPESEAGKALLDVMGEQTKMTVERTAKQIANDFTKHLKKRAGCPKSRPIPSVIRWRLISKPVLRTR